MNKIYKAANTRRRRFTIGLMALALPVLAVSALLLGGRPAQAAACVQTTDYGQISGSVNLPGSGTYRVWSRIMVPDTTNSTYLLEVGGTCYTVGGGSLPANTWVWVAHQNGNTTAKVEAAFNAGQVAYKAIGNKPGVKLDRLVFTSDLACTPTGDGANCNTPPSDTQPPSVELTAPADGSTVTGSVQLAATAGDNNGVSKVEFYVNSALVKTSTAAPHTYQWETAPIANGTYLLAAKAFDVAGNISSDSVTVTVQNGDKQAPTTPANLKATAPTYNRVDLTWSASTDNVGVTGYVVLRNTVPIATLGNVTSYADNSVISNVSYSYQVQALDKAGNKSAATSPVSVTTPKIPDTQAPSAPANLTARAVSQNQINITWNASTDNVGVASYDVYRSRTGSSLQKIATVTNTSYGDTGLSANTGYSYYVVAKDGAGNSSQASATVNATTQPAKRKRGVITGTVTSQSNGRRIAYARVVVAREGENHKHIYQANSNGKYRIGRLEPGLYRLSFRAYNYRTTSFSTNLQEGAVVTKDIKLQRR